MSMRGELTKDTYNRMLNSASTAANQAAQADAQLITATLINNKVDNLAFPKTDEDRAASLILRQNIEEMLRAERSSAAGGVINEKRRQEIIDNAIISFGSSGDAGFWATMWGSGKEVPDLPLMAMTPQQKRKVHEENQYMLIEGVKISRAMYDAIRRDLTERGVVRPTNAAVVTRFSLENGAGTSRVIKNEKTGAVISVPLDRYYALRDEIRKDNSEGTDAEILAMYEAER